MTYEEKRKMCIKLEKRAQEHQKIYDKSEIQYNRDDIYTALHTLIKFFNANASLGNMNTITETHKFPNPTVAYAGAYFLMMISEFQTQGIIDTEDFVNISDNLTNQDGIALAYTIAFHCK